MYLLNKTRIIHSMNGLLLWLHKLWLLVFFVPYIVIITILGVLGLLILKWIVGGKAAGRIIAPRWARCVAFFLPLRVTAEGAENVDPDQAYVVVANHLSMLDILAIFGWSGLDLRWVVKHEIRHVPLIGWGCRILNYVFVDRSNRELAVEAINRATAQLEPGEGMMFFPEGTRSKSGELLTFKMGAFKTAINQEMPILPISIRGTYELMPSGSIFPKQGNASIIIHPPLHTNGIAKSDASVLAEKAHQAVTSGLESSVSKSKS